eukprot:scaffold237055_cov39-Prasinocladus_malaysianus.AAC.3
MSYAIFKQGFADVDRWIYSLLAMLGGWSREARLQVELAELDFKASRLVRARDASGARGTFGDAMEACQPPKLTQPLQHLLRIHQSHTF